MKIAVAKRTRRKTPAIRALRTKAANILSLLNQDRAELSIALVGNAEIRRLNARYRDKDAPTDVLSFPNEDELPSGETLLGDVVISVEQAGKQAREKGHSLARELDVLLVHGILHLLGYDHERSRRDERIMQALERKLLAALGAGRI